MCQGSYRGILCGCDYFYLPVRKIVSEHYVNIFRNLNAFSRVAVDTEGFCAALIFLYHLLP